MTEPILLPHKHFYSPEDYFTVGISNICSALDVATIGTKVIESKKQEFLSAVGSAIIRFDWATSRTPGQGVIPFPEGIPLISCGNTFVKDVKESELVGRMHRRVPRVAALRSGAGIPPRPPAKSCSLVIYAKEAYNGDPDVVKEGDATECDYVIVAVLSSVVDSLPYPATVFVHNIAGGNKGFWPKTDPADNIAGEDINDIYADVKLLHWIISEAKKTEEGAESVILVAD